MENATRFDLNEAMARWKEGAAVSPSFRAEDLDELESHLRDSVDALKSRGLSEREAFWVSRDRIGTGDQLECEYGKINSEQIWLRRALWMVAGSMAVALLSALASTLAQLSATAIHLWAGGNQLLGPVSLAAHMVALTAVFAAAWRVGKQGGTWLTRVSTGMQARPIAGALCVFLLLMGCRAASAAANALLAKTMPVQTYAQMMQWNMVAALVSFLFWPALLAWLLVRLGRRGTCA